MSQLGSEYTSHRHGPLSPHLHLCHYVLPSALLVHSLETLLQPIFSTQPFQWPLLNSPAMPMALITCDPLSS